MPSPPALNLNGIEATMGTSSLLSYGNTCCNVGKKVL